MSETQEPEETKEAAEKTEPDAPTPPRVPPHREPEPPKPKSKLVNEDKNTIRRIERVSTQERDNLKESVARRERIEKLEKIRRSVRNCKQYERRLADEKRINEERAQRDVLLPDEDEVQDDHQTGMFQSTVMRVALGGAAVIMAGLVLFKH